MGYFIVRLKAVIVLIIDILVLSPTNIAGHVLQTHMAFELIFIKETGLTKPTIGMQKYDITKVINISSLHVLVQLGCGVQLLLFEDAGLFIQAHITQHSFMLLF